MRKKFFNYLNSYKEDFYFLYADVGLGLIEDLHKKNPKKVINTGICEAHMIAMGSGLCSKDYKTFTYSIGPFTSTQALAQIRNEASYHKSNICMISSGATFDYEKQGFTHLCFEDLNILSHYPGLNLYYPGNTLELDFCFQTIINNMGPSYIKLPKLDTSKTRAVSEEIGFFKLCEDQSDTIILSCGPISYQDFDKNGLEHYSCPQVNGFNTSHLLNNFLKKKIIILEESPFPGPLFSRTYQALEKLGLQNNIIKSINPKYSYHDFGDRDFMKTSFDFTNSDIEDKIKECLKK
ncbi:hypothetical protein N9O57_01005 [bacterium]|nr:hypothetical protein [bacterium]